MKKYFYDAENIIESTVTGEKAHCSFTQLCSYRKVQFLTSGECNSHVCTLGIHFHLQGKARCKMMPTGSWREVGRRKVAM